MQIKNILTFLENLAPPHYQESYDNAGLIVGNPEESLKGVLICLDAIEAVVDEAIELGCNLIIAHHPIVFRGLKRFNGLNYVERTVIKAIKNDIAIYAIHTNLDNMYHRGVNAKIAEKIGLQNTRILAPKKGLKKLYTFVPATHSDIVRKALFEAGGGQVDDWRDLSYAGLGVASANGHSAASVKLEVSYLPEREGAVLSALHRHHPEEHPAYDIVQTENRISHIGSGMIGDLPQPMAEKAFLEYLKKVMKIGCVRYTRLRSRKVSKVAVCGGAGGFLLQKAIAQKAQVFITADYKYHEFFDADNRIVIADIGHYESEQFTIDLLYEIITEKFSTFVAHCTKVNTNPIKYL